jgi:NAD(P)-dependent dehydrogenase (short-subunit alcohol dehydrogenase family)
MQTKNILITGCSSGIGHAAALALTQCGHHVVASCRKKQDVTKLIELGLEAVYIDMDDPKSIAQGLSDVLAKTNGRIDILINNAGYGQIGALEDIPYDVLINQFSTNVFGLMELTRLVIPIMRQQKQGRIINISSMLGIVGMPFRGAYNASKFAVEGLTDTLRLELKSANIQVITIQPGPIESRFRDNAVDFSLKKINTEKSYFQTTYQNMLGSFRQQKTDSVFTQGTHAVIKKLTHAIESKNPKIKYPVTIPSHLFILLKRLLSVKMLDRFITIISRKELNQ